MDPETEADLLLRLKTEVVEDELALLDHERLSRLVKQEWDGEREGDGIWSELRVLSEPELVETMMAAPMEAAACPGPPPAVFSQGFEPNAAVYDDVTCLDDSGLPDILKTEDAAELHDTLLARHIRYLRTQAVRSKTTISKK
jgi:hypothetical protein